MLVELVEHDAGVGVAFEFDHDAHSVAVGFVAHIADFGDLLLLDKLRDLHNQPSIAALSDLIRELGDDDRLAPLADRLNARPRLHSDAATARAVGLVDPGDAEDCPRGRKVRPLNVLHQTLNRDFRVVDVSDGRPNHLAQVVRGNIRRHSDGDAGGTVDKQVRKSRGQDERLLPGRVVGRGVINSVGVEVAQELRGEPVESRLRVAHGGCRVTVDIAEVPLAINEWMPH